jgi:hypothetical protein
LTDGAPVPSRFIFDRLRHDLGGLQVTAIECLQFVEHNVDRVICLDLKPPVDRKLACGLSIRHGLANRGRQSAGIARREDAAGLTMVNDLWNSAGVAPDHGRFCGHGLERDLGNSFTERGDRQKIQFAQHVRNVFTVAGELDVVFQIQPSNVILDARTLRSVSDDDKAGFESRLFQQGRGLEKGAGPFCQPQDGHHSD